MSFLDIDQILSEEDRLPCIFEIDAADLGHLDPTNAQSTLPAGSRVELPLWLALELRQQSMVKMDLPKHFGRKMREELTSTSLINLRDYSHYFFSIGLKLGQATSDEDLIRTIRVAFCGERYKALLVQALTKNWHDDVSEFAHQLTASELKLLNDGLEASKQLKRWRSRQSHFIETSRILGGDLSSTYSEGATSGSKRTRK